MLYVRVQGFATLFYGLLLGIYGLLAYVKSTPRKTGYSEIAGDNPDEAESIKPGTLTTLLGCILFVFMLFQLAWLIFGSVETLSVKDDACVPSFIHQVAFGYIVAQWSLLALFLFLFCMGCCCAACCVAAAGFG